MPEYLSDSLLNLVTAMGTSKDRASHTSYAYKTLSQLELDNAYRFDWVAAKAIDIPAQDATREWRYWQADKDQITNIEKEEKKFDLQAKVKLSLIRARLHGGAAIVIGLPNQDWSEPLDIERVGKGDLKYLHAVTRYELAVSEIDYNIESEFYGLPKYYTINNGFVAQINIHPSRVVRFIGRKQPNSQATGADQWGDSLLLAIDDAVKNAGVSQAAISTMMQEANVDVIRIPGFMQNVATAEYRNKMITRWSLAATGKSMNRSLMMDKEEEWTKLNPSFAQLPELMRLYLQIAAAAGDVPATRFLGQAAGGLNATGDSDIRNYYDNVGSLQKNDISTAMDRLDEVLIRSAIGDRPDEIYYKWRPLWQPTETEKADIALKKSQTIANYVNTGLIPPEAMSTSVVNMLIEDGLLPGLEAAIEEAEEVELLEADEPIDENDPDMKEQFQKGKTAPVEEIKE